MIFFFLQIHIAISKRSIHLWGFKSCDCLPAHRVCLTIHHNSVCNALKIVCIPYQISCLRTGPLTTSGNINKSRRKRIRCDSDPKDGHKAAELVYKGRNDIDTDTEMEGLVCSASSSPLSSPTQGTCPESSSSNVKGSKTLTPTWKRDEQFYMEDGSCVLLVEDTLFNVHHFTLQFVIFADNEE